MQINEIKAKTILRKHKRIDSWFISQYGMNFYRGCNHNCVYCDGCSESYYVDGEFVEDVWVKVNAIDIFKETAEIMIKVFDKLTVNKNNCEKAMIEELYATEKIYEFKQISDGFEIN